MVITEAAAEAAVVAAVAAVAEAKLRLYVSNILAIVRESIGLQKALYGEPPSQTLHPEQTD